MKIALFIMGIATGLALYRILSNSVYRYPWTICTNCEYRKETEHAIPCPPKEKKLLPEEDSFED